VKIQVKLSLLSFVLAVAVAAAAPAQTPLKELFPHEADVTGGSGIVALELPDDVVAACRADLSDLRLFDLNDYEVPFAYDAGAPIGAPKSAPQRAEAKVLEIEREEVHREDGPPLQRENYEIAMPDDAPESGAWELLIDSNRAQFVRRVRIEARQGGEAFAADESIFRLPGSGGAKTRVPVPDPNADRLYISIEGEEGFFLEPRFSFHSERDVGQRPPIIVTLDAISTDSEGGRTVVVASRPSGIVPARLRFDTTSAWFDRNVEVWDLRAALPDRRVGGGKVKRMQGTKELDREVSVDMTTGEQLRIEIENGDSPPLADLQVIAVAPRPRLVFNASAAGDGRIAVLRFGGGRASRPRYDLRLPTSVPGSEPQPVAAALVGDVRRNPAYRPAPALDLALKPGATVDDRLFAYVRRFSVAPSAEGVSRFRLDVRDLAVARPDLGDLRVVDAERRQWPYLIGRKAHIEQIPLRIAEVVHEDGSTHYSLAPPSHPIRFTELTLETDAAFIDRAYELRAATPEREAAIVSAGRLNRAAGDRKPLRIGFAPVRVESLELTVKNGDDSPLEIRSARSAVGLPEIFLVAPPGEYDLLLGYEEAEAPRYEVAQRGDAVFTTPFGDATAGRLELNPRFSRRARLTEGATATRTLPQLLLWAALAVAVLVLAIVTARIVRSEPDSGSR
jgi:hypothetical protein